MKTFVFWRSQYKKPGSKPVYQGMVGGALWDQFVVNARAGYGTCYLIDGLTFSHARSLVPQARPTATPNVLAYGDYAAEALRKVS